MDDKTVNLRQFVEATKRLGHRLLTIGGNRLELLTVEVQEERAHQLHIVLMALGVGAFGLLGAIALTAALVVWLWAWSPLAVLLILTGLYGGTAACLYWRLQCQLREWQMFAASLEQLRKDRACLEKILA